MDTGLKDKVSIVTGGASGLWHDTSHLLAAEGSRVFAADIKKGEVGHLVGKLTDAKAVAVKCDVTNEEQVRGMVDQALETFGRVDVLVNNAGIAGPQGPWHQLGADKTERALTNSRSTDAHNIT